jgi:hypothetical protein
MGTFPKSNPNAVLLRIFVALRTPDANGRVYAPGCRTEAARLAVAAAAVIVAEDPGRAAVVAATMRRLGCDAEDVARVVARSCAVLFNAAHAAASRWDADPSRQGPHVPIVYAAGHGGSL